MSLLRWENNEDSPASPLPQPLKLLYFSTAKYEHDWHCTLHTHQCIEIFYIVKGSGSFRVEDASFSIAHDDVVVINSGVAHTEVSSAHDPLEYIVLGISGNDFLLGGQQDQRYCILTDLSATRPLLPYRISPWRSPKRKRIIKMSSNTFFTSSPFSCSAASPPPPLPPRAEMSIQSAPKSNGILTITIKKTLPLTPLPAWPF